MRFALTLLVALLFAIPAFANEGRREQPDDNLTNNIATAMTGPIRVDGGNSYAENRANIDRSGNSSSRSDATGGYAENRNIIDIANSAQGGAGGQGGTGLGLGLGVGISKSQGGNVEGSGNSTNSLRTGPQTNLGVNLSKVETGDVILSNHIAGDETFNALSQFQENKQNQNQNLSSSNRSGDVTGGDQQLTTVQDTAQANQQRSDTDVDVKVEGDQLNIEGDTITYEDEKDPVNTAATVFASQCSAGVSAQTFGMGASLGTTNPMCDLALASEMALKVGNEDLAAELALDAAKFARSRANILRRWFNWIPLIGPLL